jgi:hypothetical protein
MKKISAMLLLLVFYLSLIGCSRSKHANVNNDCFLKCNSLNGDEYKECMKVCLGSNNIKSQNNSSSANKLTGTVEGRICAKLKVISDNNKVSFDSDTCINQMKNTNDPSVRKFIQMADTCNDRSGKEFLECIGLTPDKERFNMCLSAFQQIKIGLEIYISDNNSAKSIDSAGDVLSQYIIPGCEQPNTCKGELAKRTLLVCNDYTIIGVGYMEYEITGHAKDSSRCGIIVTEKGIRPSFYSECTMMIPVGIH